MKKNNFGNMFLLFVLTLSLVGCGGGGDGGSSPSAAGTANTVVSGTASKGVIANGIVKIFAVNADGGKDLLKTAMTNDQGRYEVSIGEYQGPVLVEASGEYLDEATGLIATVTEGTPLRAVIADAKGSVKLAVTPLTELAVQKAEDGTMTVDKITAANALVSNLFGFNIVNSQPVAPDVTSLAAATVDEKNYTLALAAISQMSDDASTTVSDILADLGTELVAEGELSWTSIDGFDVALTDFLTSNPNNQTGVTSVADTGLVAASRTAGLVRLRVADLPEGITLEGLEGTLVFPDGVRVDVDDEAITASGVATGSLIEAQYFSETSTEYGMLDFALINASGFAAGEVVAIKYTIPGQTLPVADSFTLSDIVAVDGDGATVSGVTASLVVEAI